MGAAPNLTALNCPNLDLCIKCIGSQCCYYHYLKGNRSCFPNCICKKYCRSNDEYLQKFFQIDFKTTPYFLKDIKFKKISKKIDTYYIPEVKPIKKEIMNSIPLIKESGLDTITVSLSDFLNYPTGRINKCYKDVTSVGGLHSYLDFDGTIILSTDMKDALCDNLTPNRYADYLRQLEPDFAITIDTYYYDSQPPFITKIKLYQTLIKNVKLANLVNIPMMGMTLGVNNSLFQWYAKCLDKLGCNTFVIDCYGYLQDPNYRKIGREKIAMKIYLLKKNHPNNKLLLLSCSPSKGHPKGADYYSSYLAWQILNSGNSYTEKLNKLKMFNKIARKFSEYKISMQTKLVS